VKYNEFVNLFIPFFRSSSTGQTRRRIFTLHSSNDADSRKTVPFGGFVDIARHFGGDIPQTLTFGPRKGVFKPKWAKYKQFHIIKTTARISTKFCTTIETPSSHYGWSQYAPNKSKMAAAAILKVTKIAISPQRFDRSLQNLVR